MNYLASAYVHSHMVDVASAGIEEKVARLSLIHRNLLSSGRLIPGAAPGSDSEMGINRLSEAGAVCAVCQACPA